MSRFILNTFTAIKCFDSGMTMENNKRETDSRHVSRKIIVQNGTSPSSKTACIYVTVGLFIIVRTVNLAGFWDHTF